MDAEGKRLRELALRAAHTGELVCTRFLEPPEEVSARAAANAAGCLVAFEGGYALAERRMAGFFTGDVPAPEDFPLRRILAAWDARYGSVGHRDLLGALMGLGLARETMGDIAFAQEGAVLFVHQDVAEYVLSNLESAGRVKLRLRACGPEIAPAEPRGARVVRTAPSTRLDAVLAAACDLSRQEAQSMVRAGLVKRNHVPETRGDARLEPGDIVSARGLGRFRLDSVGDASRKGRLRLGLFVYGK